MARPTKTPDENRKTQLKFWGTKTEQLELDQLAASFGMNRADFMRFRCLGVEPLHPKATPDRESLIRILGILGHVRSDLNKILQDRWSYKYVTPERAEGVFATIEDMADQLHKALET
jgi:hypothetical protein